MDEAGFGADKMGNAGQEGDNVMLGFTLNAVNFFNVEIGLFANNGGFFGMTPSLACASQA